MLSKITDALAKRKLTAWQVREGRRTSHQSFLALTERECRRQVDTQSWMVSIHQLRTGPQGPVLGLASFKISPPEMPLLEQRIDEALFSAGLVTNQPFELPEKGAAAPEVELADPAIGPTLMDEFEDRLKAAIAKEASIRLSAAEFFADRVELRLVNHRGLDVSQVETSLHTEFILLSRRGSEEKEFIDRFTRRLSRDFKIEEEVAASAEQARAAAEATLPKTGKFPVLLSDEPLDRLFTPLLARASARLKYNRMIDATPGQLMVESTGAGDPVTLWSNPLLPGAMGSYRYDVYGTPAERVCLLEKSRLVRQIADKRYADYLGVPVTGEAGNIEVEGGSQAYNDLRKPAGTGKTLYHLQAFSAFEPNPITGAFSAEIRSGFEITASGARPIKGGSVSGVLHKDLASARMSRERVQRENVLVPKGVLFEGLTVAGA